MVLRMAGVYVLFGRWTVRSRMADRRAARDPAYRAQSEKRQERRRRRGGKPLAPPTHKEIVLVGWTGMRGILTLAAAAAVPEVTSPGNLPFPGRDQIQAIALFVTLGTLLIQGTTVRTVARWLKFDLAEERAEDAEMHERGQKIVAEAQSSNQSSDQSSADIDDTFERQRLALGRAVAEHRLTEEVARELIEDIDLRQAARHTGDPTYP
jgi:monovalent cation/hydrogen antiporter